MTILIFIVSLLGAIAIGVPIAWALLLCGISLMFWMDIFDVQILAQTLVNGADSFSLLAIPFFVLAGEIMNAGGLSQRIVDLPMKLVGHRPGGLGYVGVLFAVAYLGDPVVVPAVDDHMRPGGRQSSCQPQTDPSTRPGDQRHLPGQVEHRQPARMASGRAWQIDHGRPIRRGRGSLLRHAILPEVVSCGAGFIIAERSARKVVPSLVAAPLLAVDRHAVTLTDRAHHQPFGGHRAEREGGGQGMVLAAGQHVTVTASGFTPEST